MHSRMHHNLSRLLNQWNTEKEERYIFGKMTITATQLWGKKPFLNNTAVNYTMINLNRIFRILFEL